ncbi:hypothetical protein ADM96_15655 [Burkholderia sp. ST111]|nr:hypothetical protein ADM96_15655 [Burkholderia sp. ST111]
MICNAGGAAIRSNKVKSNEKPVITLTLRDDIEPEIAEAVKELIHMHMDEILKGIQAIRATQQAAKGASMEGTVLHLLH